MEDDSTRPDKNLCLTLVNSEWYDGWGRLEDRLASATWLREFLRVEFSGLRLDAPTTGVRKSLYRLRSLLREMIEKLAAGGQPTTAQLLNLNTFLSSCTWKYSLSVSGKKPRLNRVPQRRNWGWVMAVIAGSAFDLLLSDKRRIKICPNQGCRWAFYDTTKGRTRRWCTSTLCGNLYKVRRYRARKKLQQRR